jgi:hypothetical protein
MSRSNDRTTWTNVGWGLGIALSSAALVRAVRPERSTVDIAITAATPWLLVPSGALLAGGALLTRRPTRTGAAPGTEDEGGPAQGAPPASRGRPEGPLGRQQLDGVSPS